MFKCAPTNFSRMKNMKNTSTYYYRDILFPSINTIMFASFIRLKTARLIYAKTLDHSG